jgi:hypothetical protein
LKFNNGGFSAPGSANATANGDKHIYWNTATLKVAQGLDDSTLWWQCNASLGTPVFKWFGGTSTAPALSMTLDQTAALKVVGGFGCNGATAQTASTGYGTPTNVAKQASFDATSITLPNLAKESGS